MMSSNASPRINPISCSQSHPFTLINTKVQDFSDISMDVEMNTD